MVISGLMRRPEEKMAYEEKFLEEVMKNEFQKIKLVDTLPGFPGAGRKLVKMLREPWPAETDRTGRPRGEAASRASSSSRGRSRPLSMSTS